MLKRSRFHASVSVLVYCTVPAPVLYRYHHQATPKRRRRETILQYEYKDKQLIIRRIIIKTSLLVRIKLPIATMNTASSKLSLLLPLRRSLIPRDCHRRAKSSIPETSNATAGGHQNSSSFFWYMWERYTAALMARPLTVKATTASLIFFVSDSATQYLMDPTADYQLARAGSGAAFGVVATGWLHYWWGFLEAFVGKRVPVAQHRFANTVVKVLLDQGIGAPCYVFTYYVITNFIQELSAQSNKDEKKSPGELLKETSERAAEMLPPTMMRHWTLWPAVHTLNFYYSPLHHRVLVQNMVLVGWSGYLSHLNNGGLMTPKEEVEETIALKRRETEAIQRIQTTKNLHAHTSTHAEIKVKSTIATPATEKL